MAENQEKRQNVLQMSFSGLGVNRKVLDNGLIYSKVINRSRIAKSFQILILNEEH